MARSMSALLGLSWVIDWVNARIAVVANCLVLLACPISVGQRVQLLSHQRKL